MRSPRMTTVLAGLPFASELRLSGAAEESCRYREGRVSAMTQISSAPPRVTERARLRDVAPPGWWRCAAQAAIAWALGYGFLRSTSSTPRIRGLRRLRGVPGLPGRRQ
jgi:hypothetical protein